MAERHTHGAEGLGQGRSGSTGGLVEESLSKATTGSKVKRSQCRRMYLGLRCRKKVAYLRHSTELCGWREVSPGDVGLPSRVKRWGFNRTV